MSAVSGLDGSQTCLAGPYLSSVCFLTNEEFSGSLGDLWEK